MADRFAPRLVNGPFDDSALYIAFRFERRAMLFDLGRIESLSVREILKISDVFVSHTHIDHFIGFDHLLRCSLNREDVLRLFGPKGIIANVQGKLAGYTWNLVEDYPLVIAVYEVNAPDVRRAELHAAHKFALEAETIQPFSRILLEEPSLRVQAAILDHKIPCLAFSLEESNRLNVRPDVLASLDLQPGAWLDDLKKMLREGQPLSTRLEVSMRNGNRKDLTLGEWRDLLIVESPGQKIAYVVDNQYNPGNAEQIISLVSDADVFYCEAAFSQADEDKGRSRFHLTATQAGLLARQARVKRFVPFHFSARYESEPDRLRREALSAFGDEDGTAVAAYGERS